MIARKIKKDRRTLLHKKRKKISDKKFPSILMETLKENDISVAELEMLTGIPRSVIYRLLDGSRGIKIENAFRIVKSLNGLISYDDLMNEKDKIKIKKDLDNRSKYFKTIH